MATTTTNTNASLVPVVVTTSKIITNVDQLINVNGMLYFEGDEYKGKGSELYKLDANNNPVLVAEIDKSFNGSIINSITNINGILYFGADDGTKQGLYRIDPTTNQPQRLSDKLFFAGYDVSANIVTLGNSDYFLSDPTSNSNGQLWKIDRTSGAVSKVNPAGLPTDFSFKIETPNSGNNYRAANNILSVGNNLYFQGNGKVWKFDPTTNNTSSIVITGKTYLANSEFHQIGNSLFFKASTSGANSGDELYKIDENGNASIVSDISSGATKYSINDNNFVDVNGTLYFTSGSGREIWKLDSSGKVVLAGTINQPVTTNNASQFVNVNGTLYFVFDDGKNSEQIWKLNSDGTTAPITTITPNPTYGKTFVGDLKAIGDKLYFTSNDAQYGGELRELNVTTGELRTFDLSPGSYASSVASSYLESKIIDVNGTTYFAESVHPDGASYVEDRIFKLASPTPNPTPTPTPTPTEPPLYKITAIDNGTAETLAGEAPKTGRFEIVRLSDLNVAKEVNYVMSGLAVNGVDYQKVEGKVTFAAGQEKAYVDIVPIDDKIYEGNESVVLSILKDNGTGVQTYDPAQPFKIASNLADAEILSQLLGTTTGLSNIKLTVTGDKQAYGTFGNDPFNLGNGIVLSTGKVTDLSGPNLSSGTTTSFGTKDDRDGGFDPITLQIDFSTDENADRVFFQYVFGSEEFTDFSGSSFNDSFTLTLNGVNLAKLSDDKTATINNLTPSADPKTWSPDYIDNPQTTGPLKDKVILDGYTKTLTFSGDLIPNSKNTIEIKIKDVGDGALDSAVFLKGGSLGIVDPNAISAKLKLIDNELPPLISISDASFKEGKNGTKDATFTVNLSGQSSRVTTVDYSTADGTAIAGSDYTNVDLTTISFAPGETSKQIVVPIIGDLTEEPDETFKVNLSNAINAKLSLTNSSATGTILNDDTPVSLAVTDANAAETNTDPGQFVITRGGDLTKAQKVQYKLSGKAANGKDYQNLTETAIFAAGVDKAVIDIKPIDDKIYEGDETVTLTISTDDYIVTGANSANVTIADNDPVKPTLLEPIKNLLMINGGSENTLLKFTKASQQGNDRSEIDVFTVDDDLGSIDGIKPGENGYLVAAIARAQSIFSSLGNSDFDKQWDGNSQRFLNITPGDKLGFLKIDNDTIDSVKNDLLAGKQPTNISLSIPTANGTAPLALAATTNGYNISFNNLVLNVQPIDNLDPSIGSGLQRKSEGQVIDFRSTIQATVDLRIVGDANYNNFVAFYEVEDEQGTLANGLKPKDAGYAKAAIESALFKSRFKSQEEKNLSVSGVKILAPIVVANGTFDDFLKQNPQNKANSNIHAYFNYIGANTDNFDHFRLLGDNKFGVEDLYGGGDRDFNDVIIQLTVK